MIFLCGLFISVQELPVFLQPVSYCIPITYGVDILKAAMIGTGHIAPILSFMGAHRVQPGPVWSERSDSQAKMDLLKAKRRRERGDR